jgi:predicted amidophosphoribosyltransferase
MVNIYNQRELICIECGRYFMGKTAKYCPECAKALKRERKREYAKRLYEKQKQEKEALFCE